MRRARPPPLVTTFVFTPPRTDRAVSHHRSRPLATDRPAVAAGVRPVHARSLTIAPLHAFAPPARSLDDVSPGRVVVGEPFYHALEGHPLATALRFWRRANALDAAAVEPRGATVVLEALRSDELRAAYGPLPDSILGLPHGAAAAAWREAAATLVPLDLADYAYEVASETVLCAFDFERPFEDVAARVAVPDCGPVDAFALAVRFHGRGADARRLARFHVGEPGATDVLFELKGDGSCALDVAARKKRPREE